MLTNGLTDSQLGQVLRQLDSALWGQGRSFILANGVDGAASLADKLSLASRHCDAILLLGKNYDHRWFDDLDVSDLPPLLTMNQTLDEIDGIQFDQGTDR